MKLELSRLAVLGALVYPLVKAQVSALSACGNTCYNDLLAKGAELGCTGSDPACLCTKPDFKNGIADCANSLCQNTGEDPAANIAAVNNLCASLEAAPAEEVPAPASSPTEPTPNPAPENPSSVAPSVEQSPSPTTSPSAADGATPAVETSAPSTSYSLTNPATASATSSTSSSSTSKPASTSAPDKTSPSNQSDDDGPAGLSVGAKAGIGVGVGAVVLLGLLGLFFILRSRKRNAIPAGRKISEPLPPASGRSFSDHNDARGFAEKNVSELEMTSRRYEDMLPRQTPRHMV